jgi:hypothetical protein
MRRATGISAASGDPGRGTLYVGANGRPVDLLAPKASDIDFAMIAEQLAKLARYVGGTPGVVFSVAQHTVVGADAVLAATKDETAAAYFVLHDAHEAWLADDPTPKKRALEAIAFAQFGALADAVLGAFAELTGRFDRAIHEAAGLPWPPPARIADVVATFDKKMLGTEWRAFMGGVDRPGARPDDPAPLPIALRPMKWWLVQAELEQRFAAWLPALKGRRT